MASRLQIHPRREHMRGVLQVAQPSGWTALCGWLHHSQKHSENVNKPSAEHGTMGNERTSARVVQYYSGMLQSALFLCSV